MPINPQQLAQQIEAQSPRLQDDFKRLRENVTEALELYRKSSAYQFVEAVTASKKEEALAVPYGNLDEVVPIGEAPASYCVVATDSSPIPPDRHGGTALYYVINVGRVMLRYGNNPAAAIDSQTLFQATDAAGEEQETLAASFLDTRSALEEIKAAYDFAAKHEADLVFRDGPLTLWRSINLRGQSGSKMRDDYYRVLAQFEQSNIPVVGYISNTHSNAVVDTLRVVNGQGSSRFAGVQDAMLFRELLPENCRGPVFGTSLKEPKELEEYIGQVYFTYLRTENEMIRVEFPKWLADAPARLETALAIVLRQSRLGQGYPVALMEAHESAVLRGDDRELLRLLLEDKGLLQQESEKGRSKRLRGI